MPDISLNGDLSSMHATVDDSQYRMVRGLLSHNLGENLDDLLQFRVAVPTNEYQEPILQNILSGIAYTCMYINIQLQDVTLDLRQSNRKDTNVTTFARVNFVKSLLTYESFRYVHIYLLKPGPQNRRFKLIVLKLGIAKIIYMGDSNAKRRKIYTIL